MGNTNFDSINYAGAVDHLKTTGQTFARSTTAQTTGNFNNIAEILDPRKLKNGIRECCFAPGFDDALPIVVSIDGTASMGQVPFDIQKGLPDLIGLITEQGISDRPNVLFMCHDDEKVLGPDAVFQMSQFETGADELLEALNELIIPEYGGGNNGEAYHLPIYAAARHTRLEALERDGDKGFFFLIGDEEPFYHNGNPAENGTSKEIAKEVFGDKNEATVTMLDALRELGEKYHVYIIRPGHTCHGQNRRITEAWKDLLKAAGLNPECVLEIEKTEAIIPTMALTIGATLGADRDEMVDVLRTNGVGGVDDADRATTAIVPVKAGALVKGVASAALATTDGGGGRRKRRK